MVLGPLPAMVSVMCIVALKMVMQPPRVPCLARWHYPSLWRRLEIIRSCTAGTSQPYWPELGGIPRSMTHIAAVKVMFMSQ